jgi:hypothetical protein
MQDSVTTEEFRPGKIKIQNALNANMVSFLQTSSTELDTAWKAAEAPDDLLAALEAVGWIRADTEWGGKTYKNVYRAIKTSATEELHYSVSVLQNGAVTVTFHPWWKPG